MRKPFERRLSLESLERREVFSATVLEMEPNDRGRAATPVVVPDDGIVHLAGVAAGRADKDFFIFRAPASGPASLVADAAAGKDIKVEVETLASVDIFETEPNDGINEGTFDLVAGQRYLLRVRSAERVGDVAYTVHLQLTPAVGGGGAAADVTPSAPGTLLQETEPNDRQRTADRFSLAPGDSIRLTGESSKSDKDFFRFTASSSGQVETMVFASPGRRVQFTVEDAAGNKVFETEPNNGVNGGTFDVVAGTTYFLRARGTRDAVAAYNVDLAFSS